jgi:hypothetical protein
LHILQGEIVFRKITVRGIDTHYRKGVWRFALMLNNVLTNKEIVSLGFMTMADYYLKVCVN